MFCEFNHTFREAVHGICTLATPDKQLLARKVGSDLVRQHWKRRHYTVAEVRAAARRQNIPEAWDCWALSLYTSPNDFVDHHMATGENCDYQVMHAKMVDAVRADSLLPDMIHHPGAGTELPDLGHHSSTGSILPHHSHHSGGSADTSWFSGLLDMLDGLDFTNSDW